MAKTMSTKLCKQAAARVEKLLDSGNKAAARSLYHKAAAAGCASTLSGLKGRSTRKSRRRSREGRR